MKAATDAFNRNLLMGFGATLLLLIISAIASFISIQNLLYSGRMANQSRDANLKLEQALTFLKDAETSQRGYLLTANPVFLEPYKGRRDSILKLLKEVEVLSEGDAAQRTNLARLTRLINHRWTVLVSLIDDKQNGRPIAQENLLKGKIWMDDARNLVDSMQANQLVLLQKRTERFDRFSAFTPILIIITTLIAIISTVLFFNRVRNDFAQKNKLQQQLLEKDQALAHRISITRKLAADIANGSYEVRVAEQEGDDLGNLATDLNRMAAALEEAFGKLQEKEWFLGGQALFNEIMLGQKSMDAMTLELLRGICDYVGSEMGALYLLNESGDKLQRFAAIGLKEGNGAEVLNIGEGLAGRSAAEAATLQLAAPENAENYLFETVAGTLRPAEFIAVPLVYQGRVNGILELASLKRFDQGVQNLLEDAGRAIGIAVNSLESNIRMQELLLQTQAQSEELQAQHSELENINTELEAQTNKLLASEEELRVQQEELMEANAVLEERSRMLEEKNEEIAQRNKEVQRQADELGRTTRYKSEFLANMSHELRTPLNSILLLSRLLEDNNDGSLSQEQMEYARVIQSSGKGLLALIDEVLDLSKIEAGKMELESNDVPVDELLRNMSDLFLPLAKEKNIVFRIEAGALPPSILTDQQRLEQILKNLISNAIKFTRAGSVTLQVKADESQIHFAVQDTGIGISEEHLAGIFEAFRQADGTTRRKFGGTGLGLSISKELSRLLGGDINVISEEGKGSTFTLSIPKIHELAAVMPVQAAQPFPAAETTLPAVTKPKEESRPVVQQPREAPKTMLIIEDDAPFASALRNFIQARGYKVILAPDGETGLNILQQQKPDGVLLDIMLPGKDGWEVLDELKKDPANRHLPVHVMSSLNARQESIERGASGFISKPLAFEQMNDVIKSLEEIRQKKEGGKALIIEDNLRHAKALAGFLAEHRIAAAVASTEADALLQLQNSGFDCVILETFTHKLEPLPLLQQIRNATIDKLSILLFTGQHLTQEGAQRLKQHADSIVLKTAHSYQRVLDEISLFIHHLENPAHKKQKRQLPANMDVLRGKRLLIADDDVRNIFSLTKLLEQHGISVKAATDGREAVDQMLQGMDIDAILMDIMMPEMDGFEAIRRIRKLPGCAELPIIAITAKAMKGDKEKCLEAGASDYISKPVDVDQLLSLLRVWLYERRL